MLGMNQPLLPPSVETLSFSVRCDHTTLRADTTAVLHLITELAAGPAGTRTPLSVIFALDTSGSMSGEPLNHVILATNTLLEGLSEQDRAGVVAFSDNARKICKLTPLTPGGRTRLNRAINRLSTEGRTNIEAGLRTAAKMLPRRQANERQVILLLSDGMPNVGRTSPEALGKIAAHLRPDMAVSTLGFGVHHAEPVMTAISDHGGGGYTFIRDPALSGLRIAAALAAHADVVAEDIHVTLTPSDRTEVLTVLGEPRNQPRRGRVKIEVPDLTAEQRHIIVARIQVKTPKSLDMPLAQVAVTYRPSGQTKTIRNTTIATIRISDTHRMDLEALREVLVIRAGEERREARKLADERSFEEAGRRLRAAVNTIVQIPNFVRDDGTPLADAVAALEDDALLYEQRPSASAYEAFRRGQRIEAGGQVQAGAFLPQSSDAKEWLGQAAGDLPHAVLVEVEGGRTYSLDKPINVVGRSRTCDICIPSSKVSRQAASISAQEGTFWVEDLGSANGVWMSGERVDRHALQHGDVFLVSDTVLRYEVRGPVT